MLWSLWIIYIVFTLLINFIKNENIFCLETFIFFMVYIYKQCAYSIYLILKLLKRAHI